jgi:hypothetical protein
MREKREREREREGGGSLVLGYPSFGLLWWPLFFCFVLFPNCSCLFLLCVFCVLESQRDICVCMCVYMKGNGSLPTSIISGGL